MNIFHCCALGLSLWNWHSELNYQALSKVFSYMRNLEKLDSAYSFEEERKILVQPPSCDTAESKHVFRSVSRL